MPRKSRKKSSKGGRYVVKVTVQQRSKPVPRAVAEKIRSSLKKKVPKANVTITKA